MNRSMIALLITAALGMGAIAVAGDAPPAAAPSTQQAAVDLKNTVCPVSGEDVGDCKLTVTYDNKVYHFCCDGCPEKFNKNPEKYVKRVTDDPAKYGVK